MRILEGQLALTVQGEQFKCPIAGVRDTRGQVEVAVATPFGLRRVHISLDAQRSLVEAHTFAFDYESGEVTKFEQVIEGGPVSADRRQYAGTISGGGLEGKWAVRELGPFDDDDGEAAHALGVGQRVPDDLAPAPVRRAEDGEGEGGEGGSAAR